MIKTGKIAKYFLLALVLWTPWLWAGVTVQSLVDRNEMGMGDTLTVTVSVSSTEAVEVSEPRVPSLDGFDLVNTWNSSATSSKLMQGPRGMQFETVRRQDFNYMVTPQRKGSLSIPAFEVVVEGKTYTTKPILIKVLAQGSGATQNPRGQNGALPEDEMSEEEALFNQLLNRHGMGGGLGGGGAGLPGARGGSPTIQALPKNANEVLSVQLELDKTEVYEGEQIVANWYIFTRGNLLSLDRLKFPDLKGFWKEIIEEVPSLNFTQEVINGLPYRKALLASHALFPIKAGFAVVDEYKIKGSVQVPTNPLGSFGFGPTYSFNRSSDRVKVTVKPLPTEGKPKDFSGAVGQFEVHAQVDGNQFPVNQPFSFKVRFEGAGNAKLIELPPLNLPPGIEIYDTKSESKYFKNGRSYKEFEVLLIPREQGEVKIPNMGFSMFDPQLKKYVSRSTEPIVVRIVPGQGGTAAVKEKAPGDGAKAPTVQVTPQAPVLPDILVSYQASAVSANNGFLTSGLQWPLLFLLAVLGLFFKARQEFGWGRKGKSLKDELNKRLKKVQSSVDKADFRKVGVEMTNVLYYILGEVSGLGGASLELSKLLEQSPPSLRLELGPELAKTIEKFQVLSFAPESMLGDLKNKDELRKNVKAAENLLFRAIELSVKSPESQV